MSEDPEKGIELQVKDGVNVSYKGLKEDSTDDEKDSSDDDYDGYNSDSSDSPHDAVPEQPKDWEPFKILVKGEDKVKTKIKWTPLHQVISQISDCGADLKLFDALKIKKWLKFQEPKTGMTPVLLAVSKGRLDILKRLIPKDRIFNLDKDKRVKSPNFQSRSALHEACMLGNVDIVELLCKAGWEPKDVDDHNCNAAFYAATYGHLKVLKFLLSLCPDNESRRKLLYERHTDKYTILHGAVYYKRPDDSGQENDEGAELDTIEKERLKLVIYLVDEIKTLGSQDYLMDKDNNSKITALYLAAKLGHVELVKYFMTFLKENFQKDSWDGYCRNVNGVIMLHDAAEHNRVDVVKYLCEETFLGEKKYLLDKENIWESIPFSGAASGNAVDIMAILLEYGEKMGIEAKLMIMYQNKYGWSPLHHTAFRGHVEATKFLCDYVNNSEILNLKADFKMANLAIHLAAVGGHNEVIKTMLTRADETSSLIINRKNGKKRTPLYEAAASGKPETVRLFLEKPQVSLIRKSYNEETVLHGAIRSGNLECLKEFNNVKDKVLLPLDMATESCGYTPLHLAIALQEPEMALVCLEMEDQDQKRSVINVSDKKGYTPLAQAAMTGNKDVLAKIMSRNRKTDAKKCKKQKTKKENPDGKFLWTVKSGERHFLAENECPIEYHPQQLKRTHPKQEKLEKYHPQQKDDPQRKEKELLDERSPINCLILKNPDKVIETLEKCWTYHVYDEEELETKLVRRILNRGKNMLFATDEEKNAIKFRVIVDFGMLEKYGRPEDNENKGKNEDFLKLKAFGPKYEPFAYAANKCPLQIMRRSMNTSSTSKSHKKAVEMLTHPVVKSLVDIKWNNFGFKFFAVFAFISLLFLFLLSGFTFKMHHDIFKNSTWECKTPYGVQLLADPDNCFITISKKTAETEKLGYVLLALTAFLSFFQLLHFYSNKNLGVIGYHKEKLYLAKDLSYILTLIFVCSSLFLMEDRISTALWQTGVAANVFAFITILIYMQSVEFLKLGLHIIMFQKIVVNFVKSIGILFVLLIIGFVCTFSVLSVGIDGNSYFAGLGSWSPYYKTFTMGVSGASYSDYDTGNDQAILQLNGYVLVLILFSVVIQILFLNLATGLAIDDVQEIKASSKAEMNSTKIWHIYKYEQLLLGLGGFFSCGRNKRLFFHPFFVGDLRQFVNISKSDSEFNKECSTEQVSKN